MTNAILESAAVSREVLIVDDEPNDRMLLRDALAPEGYRVTEAADGSEALAMVTERLPDVVLLDVNMPKGLDGLEVCRRVKADSRAAPVPVILVTANRGREQRLAGIRAGANDFLSKPIDLTDLRLRVRNAVNTKKLYDQVQEEYRRVAKLESLRDTLVHMIVHDLRSPLTGIQCDLQLVEMEGKKVLDRDLMESVTGARESVQTLTNMITSILDVSRLESGSLPLTLRACDLGGVVQDALALVGSGAHRVRVEADDNGSPVTTNCDAAIVRRVVVNLVANALGYSPSHEPVTVTVSRRNGHARVTVCDHGPGIQKEFQEKIFDKFAQGEAQQHGHKASSGLGLAFCKLAVEAHGGTIGVESEEGAGATFWFELPTQMATDHSDSDGNGVRLAVTDVGLHVAGPSADREDTWQ